MDKPTVSIPTTPEEQFAFVEGQIAIIGAMSTIALRQTTTWQQRTAIARALRTLDASAFPVDLFAGQQGDSFQAGMTYMIDQLGQVLEKNF